MRCGESHPSKLRPAHKQLARFIATGPSLGQFLLVINTHSDYKSEWLVNSYSKSEKLALVAPIDEVCHLDQL